MLVGVLHPITAGKKSITTLFLLRYKKVDLRCPGEDVLAGLPVWFHTAVIRTGALLYHSSGVPASFWQCNVDCEGAAETLYIHVVSNCSPPGLNTFTEQWGTKASVVVWMNTQVGDAYGPRQLADLDSQHACNIGLTR
jgi:hypothetical protein